MHLHEEQKGQFTALFQQLYLKDQHYLSLSVVAARKHNETKMDATFLFSCRQGRLGQADNNA